MKRNALAIRNAMAQIEVAQQQQVASRQTTAINGQNRALSISPELQRKVFELHMQIRAELGDVKYALLGKGMAAVLCGVENETMNDICPELRQLDPPKAPLIPNRKPLTIGRRD